MSRLIIIIIIIRGSGKRCKLSQQGQGRRPGVLYRPTPAANAFWCIYSSQNASRCNNFPCIGVTFCDRPTPMPGTWGRRYNDWRASAP